MKKEIYTKVVDEVVQPMAKHSDIMMNVEQVANDLELSVGAVRKRYQQAQLAFHRNSKHLYFSEIEINSTLLDRKLITDHTEILRGKYKILIFARKYLYGLRCFLTFYFPGWYV